MTETEWLISKDPQAMLDSLRGQNSDGRSVPYAGTYLPSNWKPGKYLISDRKLRLISCACVRASEWQGRNVLASQGELFADSGNPAPYAWGGSISAELMVERTITAVERRVGANLPEIGRYACACRIRDVVGNPFRHVSPPYTDCACCRGFGRLDDDYSKGTIRCGMCDGSGKDKNCPRLTWNGGIIPRMAQEIYAGRKCEACGGPTGRDPFIDRSCERCHGTGNTYNGAFDPDALAVLADALVDAGYGDENVLRHLRGEERCWMCVLCDGKEADACSVCGQLTSTGPSDRPYATGWVRSDAPHVRGCWAIDLLRGKEHWP